MEFLSAPLAVEIGGAISIPDRTYSVHRQRVSSSNKWKEVLLFVTVLAPC